MNVECLAYWPYSSKKTIYKASELVPGKTMVYVKKDGQHLVGRLIEIETGDYKPDENNTNISEKKGNIQLDIPGSEPFNIECHLETIPYGFDTPPRYELVMSEQETGIEFFEILGDYADLMNTFKKQIALNKAMFEFTEHDSES